MEKNMEANLVCSGHIGIMEKKMETIVRHIDLKTISPCVT